MTPMIRTFFHEDSSTFSHVVSDCASGKAAVIDPVLDYDLYSGRSSTQSETILCEAVTEQQQGEAHDTDD